jgi:hypothetical protein
LGGERINKPWSIAPECDPINGPPTASEGIAADNFETRWEGPKKAATETGATLRPS